MLSWTSPFTSLHLSFLPWKDEKFAKWWWLKPLIPAFRRQRWDYLCELKDSLFYNRFPRQPGYREKPCMGEKTLKRWKLCLRTKNVYYETSKDSVKFTRYWFLLSFLILNLGKNKLSQPCCHTSLCCLWWSILLCMPLATSLPLFSFLCLFVFAVMPICIPPFYIFSAFP